MVSKWQQGAHLRSRLTQVTLIALIVNTLAYAFEFLLLGQLDREVSIVVVLLGTAGGMVAVGWRWTPAVGALLAGGILLGNPFLLFNLSQPMTSGFFLAALAQTLSGMVTVIVGIAATVQNYRQQHKF